MQNMNVQKFNEKNTPRGCLSNDFYSFWFDT